MHTTWKDSIYRQHEQLAHILQQPMASLAARCVGVWSDREELNRVLSEAFPLIPHRAFLYCPGIDGVQISDSMEADGVESGHFGRDRSNRPDMREPVPPRGFLLSDADISLRKRRPSLTALQMVWGDGGPLGYWEPTSI